MLGAGRGAGPADPPGEVTPSDVAEQVVARIEAVNPGLNAFITFDREQVLGDAARLTEAQRRGDALGPLTTPAVSVPAGFTADGRPVGLQITGHQRAGAAVLRAAANFERARPWSARRPAA